MKDLRIVIVTWNSGVQIERCLSSLGRGCGSLDWECVVVDNASSDGTVRIVNDIATAERRISIIRNATNLGFAKACNIGAHGSDARYVLFLNPDTECPLDSLVELVQAADADPKAGILGPKITYPDGRYQDSVRRFPSVWSQVAVIFKLAHVAKRIPILRRYFAKDLDIDKEQDVDQVMGACFLVRKDLMEQKIGFDERYFVWFEEVDFCKAAFMNGWKVRYVPSSRIIHHGGSSFSQVFSVTKQKYFMQSMKKYFAKWHPGWRSWLISIFAPIGIALSWSLTTREGQWTLAVACLELLSLATIFTTWPNTILALCVAGSVFYLAWKHPPLALAAMALELLIGSKGYLLQFGGWPSTISLRILMTVAFLAGWGMDYWKRKDFKGLVELFHTRRGYLFLFILIAYADIRGIVMGNVQALKDANAWVDWLLLFPVLEISARFRTTIRKEIVPVLWVGVFWLAVKTIILEYIFSHGFKLLSQPMYLWVRRTGVGEVTHMLVNAFRIFMQSYIYAVAAFILSLCWWMTQPPRSPFRKGGGLSEPPLNERGGRGSFVWWMVVACVVILGISLSRSFWIGAIVGVICSGILLWRAEAIVWKRAWGVIGAGIAGLAIIATVLAVPIPPVRFASLVDLFGARTDVTEEAAAASRWHLLPKLWEKIMEHPILGSGFGATVTYQAMDPRILAQNAAGVYTTYAFEWGWLEHWVKFGILGIPLIAYLLLSLGRRIWKLEHEPLWFRVGAVSSLLALATLHIFTPYLNHPLGFLFFFVGEGLILSSAARKVAA